MSDIITQTLSFFSNNDFKWYLRAAYEGNADAQYLVGNLYYYGILINTNYVMACKWYEKSAEQLTKALEEIDENNLYSKKEYAPEL